MTRTHVFVWPSCFNQSGQNLHTSTRFHLLSLLVPYAQPHLAKVMTPSEPEIHSNFNDIALCIANTTHIASAVGVLVVKRTSFYHINAIDVLQCDLHVDC